MNILEKDLKRFGEGNKFKMFLTNPIFRYSLLFRLNQNVKKSHPLFLFLRIWYKNLANKYGIQIPLKTRIGGGLLINHYGGIILNQGVVMGENCNLSQGVTIGSVSRGKYKGCPKIGNRVWIGANAVVIGNISIGDNVLIAPLSYINCDIPDNAVVSGNPCKIINYNGSEMYVKNIS